VGDLWLHVKFLFKLKGTGGTLKIGTVPRETPVRKVALAGGSNLQECTSSHQKEKDTMQTVLIFVSRKWKDQTCLKRSPSKLPEVTNAKAEGRLHFSRAKERNN